MAKDVGFIVIREKFQNGFNETQAFTSICRMFELDLPLDSTVGEWLNRLRNLDGSLQEEIGSVHYDLLISIVCQYAKLKHTTFYYDGWKGIHETLIQGRFIFTFFGFFDTFMLFDSFSDELRLLQLPVDRSDWTAFDSLTKINDGRIFIRADKDDGEYLALLGFDVSESTFTILDEVPAKISCYQVVVDSLDNSRFLLLCEEELTVIYKGHVVDNRIEVDDKGLEVGTELVNCKLVVDRLFAFIHAQDNDWKFIEYDISSDLAFKLNEWALLDVPDFVHFENRPIYVWKNNKMYVVCLFGLNFSLAVFDAVTLAWSNTNFVQFGFVEALDIDDNEILTISAAEYHSKLKNNCKVVYRVPMRKPDKLRNIAWDQIHRGNMFFGSKLYEKMASLLPIYAEFRPFA